MKEPITTSPLVKAAITHLEYHQQIMGHNFGAGDAIDKSAALSCEFFEEDIDWDEEIRMAKSKRLYSEWT